MSTYVYGFAEGNKDLKDLLGGKGANLAEMTRLRLPVPPGFTITTEACRAYLDGSLDRSALAAEVSTHVGSIERVLGRRFGDLADPLLLSVRSGAKFSMPGMMDTVLNIGLNDSSIAGLVDQTQDERFVWDAYRRLIQMFGKTVLGVPGEEFERAMDELKLHRGATTDVELTAEDLHELVETFREIVQASAGRPFPQDPTEQLQLAVLAVFDSWNGERARIYRRQEGIPENLGTAVNIMAMVFGNVGKRSGTGVAFTRDPSTGAAGFYGDYLANAQGEDVVAGIRNTVSLEDLERIDKAAYDELAGIMTTLERHYQDMCDIEFTVERGKLWMLQTRVGKRTPAAAFRIAVDMVDEGLIDMDEALSRVTGDQLARLMFPHFEAADRTPLAVGIAASPGAAVGRIVFDSPSAVSWADQGERVILVRRETNPDDLGGMIAATGILTSRGGKTSHAAVVARGMGKTCVCGADSLDVDVSARELRTADGTLLREGDVISVDGISGAVYAGELPVVDSPVAAYVMGSGGVVDPLVAAVDRVLKYADGQRRLGVRANADMPEDAERARRAGAQGIGLCRTEHMFLGDRRELLEAVIVAESEAERSSALAQLLSLQRDDFVDILRAMDGLPVTIRLLDPPLHEFLPDLTSLTTRVALAEVRDAVDPADVRLLHAVRRLHEQNPMLGLRGVRLGLIVPGLYAMQVRAIAEATVKRLRAGGQPRPQVMIPLVATATELTLAREETLAVVSAVAEENHVRLAVPVGTMIELPRAALAAGEIALDADFFSFGTNDLTQTTWGLSRDDAEGSFFSDYLRLNVFASSPFETLDSVGVGELIEIALTRGRAARPSLEAGICGEHGGDPRSIHFFHEVGLDYVSCSPYRIPVARLEAARAALDSSRTGHASST